MYCKNCGELLNENVNFCFKCGCKAGEGYGYCDQCGVKVSGTASCINCGKVFEDFKEEKKESEFNNNGNYTAENDNMNYNNSNNYNNGNSYNDGNNYNAGNNYNNQNYNNYPIKNQKSKIAAGILGILVGGLGIHRFYLGYVGIGILQIVVTVLTCGAGSLWGFIEGILILCGSTITTDADGNPLSD